MKVSIENLGAHPVRVIVDHDPINDYVLDPNASDNFEAPIEGVIELREMEGEAGEDEAEERAAALDR